MDGWSRLISFWDFGFFSGANLLLVSGSVTTSPLFGQSTGYPFFVKAIGHGSCFLRGFKLMEMKKEPQGLFFPGIWICFVLFGLIFLGLGIAWDDFFTIKPPSFGRICLFGSLFPSILLSKFKSKMAKKQGWESDTPPGNQCCMSCWNHMCTCRSRVNSMNQPFGKWNHI